MSPQDVKNYQQIAEDKHLLKKKYQWDKSFIIPSKNAKYSKHSKDLNPAEEHPVSKKRVSKGLPTFMVAKAKEFPIDYMFWNDPNKLVDRLRSLVAEKSAGNNNHDNEILAIIEELRETKVIF